MKKMCPKYIKPYMLGDMNLAGICVNRAIEPKKCPKNTNSKCEIIPPKPKRVKIKAWVGPRSLKDFMTDDRMGIMFSNWHNKSHCLDDIPCTILINRKYLKEDK